MSANVSNKAHLALGGFTSVAIQEGNVGVGELEAIRRFEVDALAGPEANINGQALAIRFRGESQSDRLRLDQRTFLDGPHMRAAVRRLLAVDRSDAVSGEAEVKEDALLGVLAAFDGAVRQIQRRASMAV